jgi:hypothetical protein
MASARFAPACRQAANLLALKRRYRDKALGNWLTKQIFASIKITYIRANINHSQHFVHPFFVNAFFDICGIINNSMIGIMLKWLLLVCRYGALAWRLRRSC